MKKLNKIKGLTLIEVMVVMSLLLGFILIFLNMDLTTNEKQNTRKVGTQLNMIVSAIDKRISIEGKSASYWKNGTSWTGTGFKDFLKQELVGANNTTCGDPTKGWKPTLNMNGLDPTTPEGQSVKLMHDNALTGKLIPCTLWTLYPYDIVPSATIASNSDGNLESVLLSFKFANATDWAKGFPKFNESYLFAKEQKNTTLLTTKSFYYSNTSQNKIDFKQCLALKEQCVVNLKVLVGSSSTDDKKFKVDSSNSFETNLGFAKSVQANEQIDCKIWTMDTSTNPATWNTRTTACGVTGGSNGDKEVGLIGDNIDAQNIKITGRCIDYAKNFPITGMNYNSDCGMLDNGSIVELTSSVLQATRVMADELSVNTDANINNLAIQEKTSTDNKNGTFKSIGKSLLDRNQPQKVLTEEEEDNQSSTLLFNTDYRSKAAQISFNTDKLKVSNLNSELESIISKNFATNNLSLTNKMYTGMATISNVLSALHKSVFNTLRTYNSNINGDMTVADTTNHLNTVANRYGSIHNFGNITSTSNGIILGDVTAKDITITGKATSEQLKFKNTYTGNLVKVSKSFNFDNLTNKYIYPNGYMEGWGAKGYSSNSGIYAKKFKLAGDSTNNSLIVNSTAKDTEAEVYDENWGFIRNYMGFRNGIELTYDQFPDTRGMFYMNDMGKVLVSGYYETKTKSGIRIGGGFDDKGNGTGFFWGRDNKMLTNEFGDRPIIANLPSSIYGYEIGQNISPLNNGYKMIVNNLTVTASVMANLYAGANYHAGLPKILVGNTITDVDVPINYIENGIGVYWETADGIYLRSLNTSIAYYLDRISYIYGQYVNLNKLGTIKGSKGDRGARGQTGINGIKGETGSQGIPGAVGERG